jgi:gliding motility-associated-like protein
MKYLNLHNFLIFFVCLLLAGKSFGQLTVTTSSSAVAMVANITGSGVSTLNQVLTCDSGVACGTFTVVPGTLLGTGTTVFGINAGVLLTTGHALAAAGAEPGTTSFNDGRPGDPAMTALALTGTTKDRCELTFDVVPQGDSISFNYIFGSEEYIHSTCGSYDDAFAFFISGPGIAGTQNMALIPGTNIPVMVNTVNCGAPCVVAGYGTYSNCTSIAAGSPFTAYYVDNTSGSNFAYRGYTTKLAAVHSVTPCDTYHLKLAIVDAGNALYDSGVFIEAGSLNSPVFKFDHTLAVGATINGVTNAIVKGCSPTSVTILSNLVSGTAQSLNLTFGGTAVNGTDVVTIPGSVTMPAGSTSLVVPVTGLPTIPAGTKTLVIYLSTPTSCGILDSISVNLIDTPSALILTPDTAVCSGTAFQIRTSGTPGLTYSWAPAASLSSTTVPQPFAFPTVTTTYTMTATLPGSGCPPIVRDLTVTVNNITIAMLTPDSSICPGDSLTLRVSGSGPYSYNWAPTASLNNPSLQFPEAYPPSATTYTVTASWPASGCAPVTASVTITVTNVVISLFNHDTSICAGTSVPINMFAAGAYTYLWSPTTGLSSPVVQNPIATPTATTTYSVIASQGRCSTNASFTITINPVTVTFTLTDTICLGFSDSVDVSFPGSASYQFLWSPGTYVSNSTIPNPIITPTAAGTFTYVVAVSSPTSPCPTTDVININVVDDSIAIAPRDTAICRGQAIQVRGYASPLFTLQWIPTAGIGVSTIINPLIVPDTSAMYVVSAQIKKCPNKYDTMWVDVQPNPTVFAGENRFVCQNDTLHLTSYVQPQWYTHYSYSWSAGTALFDSVSQTVVFNGAISREEVLTVTTPAGCIGKDSLYITVYPAEVLEAMPNLSLCPGDSAVLKPSSNLAGTSFRWIPPIYISDSLSGSPVIKPITSTNYLVVGTSSQGCKDTAAFSVKVNPAAVIYLGDSVLLYPGETYQINPQTNCTQFQWFPPYGLSDATASNPIATPEFDSKYVVVASTENGCTATDSISIYLDPESIIWVPNAFTPGNGVNNYLKIYKRGIVSLNYFRIYNRWGNLVYESNNIEDAGWDGSYKGKPQAFDVYVYTAQVVTNTGKLINKQGNVTLLR